MTFCLAQEREVSLLLLHPYCYPRSATQFQLVWKLNTAETLIVTDFNIGINMIVRGKEGRKETSMFVP